MANKELQILYSELARELVNPERFGDMALQDTIEFEPLAEIIDFPLPPETPEAA
jgi:hypothetical protein